MNLNNLRKVRDLMGQHADRIVMETGWGPRNSLDWPLVARNKPQLTAGQAFQDPRIIGCVCGWTLAALEPEFLLINQRFCVSFEPIRCRAQTLLEITPREGDNLFHGGWSPRRLSDITPHETLAYLDHLLAGGKARWEIPTIDWLGLDLSAAQMERQELIDA